MEEEPKFPTSQRNINIKVFSLEVVQRRAPYVHRQTRGLVPSLCVPVLLLPLIPPSPPSHLLHHLCSCNNQDSSCAPFSLLRFLFPSGFWLSSLTRKKKKIKSSPARLFDWLVPSPTMQLPRRQIDSDVFRHTSRSAKETQRSFHLSPKARFKWMS